MVAAIIVTYNPEEKILLNQKESLISQVDELIYVDNHSTSRDILSTFDDDKIKTIRNSENNGLAKAQNQGIIQARKDGADFVLLFDQDSIPPKGFVDGLMKCYSEHIHNHKIALIGPAIRNMLKHSVINEKGIIYQGLAIKKTIVDAATEVTFCIASGSLIPTKVFDEVGMMKEELFIDSLDLEWCLRAKSQGFYIYQTNYTYLDHCLGDGSSHKISSHSALREYYIVRNSIWLAKQTYIPTGYRIRRILSPFTRLFMSIFSWNKEYIKAEISGLYDGIKLCS